NFQLCDLGISRFFCALVLQSALLFGLLVDRRACHPFFGHRVYPLSSCLQAFYHLPVPTSSLLSFRLFFLHAVCRLLFCSPPSCWSGSFFSAGVISDKILIFIGVS